MATLEQLQRVRMILSILILVNTLVFTLLIFVVDSYYWMIINFCVYIGLVIGLMVTTNKIRRILIQQMGIIPGTIPVVVISPNQSRQPGPPPPGFVTGATGVPPSYSSSVAAAGSDPPPPYSQVGPWTTQQSGAGPGQPSAYSQSAFGQPSAPSLSAFSQPSAYSQSAFSQPSPAGGQTFSAFNQPGQNSYWNPAQTS